MRSRSRCRWSATSASAAHRPLRTRRFWAAFRQGLSETGYVEGQIAVQQFFGVLGAEGYRFQPFGAIRHKTTRRSGARSASRAFTTEGRANRLRPVSERRIGVGRQAPRIDIGVIVGAKCKKIRHHPSVPLTEFYWVNAAATASRIWSHAIYTRGLSDFLTLPRDGGFRPI